MTDAISWADFKSEIAALNPVGSPAYSRFLFRGHASEEWSLESTLERTNHSDFERDYYRLILRIKTEVEAFSGHTWPDDPSSTELDQIFSGSYDAYTRTLMKGRPHYAYMAFLRHHGFPSPLLDWSASPFVAAYFAFAPSISDGPYVAIYAYQDRASNFKFDGNHQPSIRLLGPYVSAPKRHFYQRSQYTVCTSWNNASPLYTCHDEVCKKFEVGLPWQQDIIHKFVLSRSERSLVLRELRDYNLNAFTLFGSDESLMTALSQREEPEM